MLSEEEEEEEHQLPSIDSLGLSALARKKEYEQPIDTVQDLVEDGRPLYIPSKTSIFSALRDDSRESVQLIMKARSKAYPFAGVNPPWVVESYVIIKLLFFMHINLNCLQRVK